MPSSRFALASVLLLPLALASCSAFDQQWASTPPPHTANPAAPLAGKWEGSWQSDNTDYHGPLQAIIVPTQATVVVDNVAAQQYRATLKLTFLDVGTNDYSVLLNATPGKDGRVHFEGKVDRGNFMGGIFTYDGYILEDSFFCDYSSNRDVGTFKMHRITQELLNQ